MRGRGVIAALLATRGAVALSGPAHADLCHNPRTGVAPPVVLGELQRTGSAPAGSAIILMSAVNNMCPDAKAGVLGWAQGRGATAPV
jgi:hypothetical protein